DTFEDLTPERLEEIIDEFEAGRGETVKTGPQNGREFSAPITGQTTLLDMPKVKIKTKPNGAAKPAAKKPVAKKPVKKPATKQPAKGALFVAPSGAADDLKMISGVGPVLEKKLNAFGVTQFKQVAKFTKKEIVDLDDALSFKGRIDRDEWVKQAKALAIGPDEYLKVFGKKASVKTPSVKTPSVKKPSVKKSK
ncbi:NADH-ubiquinone oxidoreductase chain E, partial [hydrothermal vent metagenome]